MPENRISKILYFNAQFDGNGNAVITIPVHIKVTGNTSSYDDDGMTSFSAKGWVRLSQNFVIIESPTIEQSFYKAIGPVLPPGYATGDKVPHIRNSDGSIDTDSAVEWSDERLRWERSLVLNARTAPNSPYETYNWLHQAGSMQWTASGFPYVTPNLFFIGTQPPIEIDPISTTTLSPQDALYRVTLTDADNANNPALTNEFRIRWRLPLENISRYGWGDLWYRWEPVSSNIPEEGVEYTDPSDIAVTVVAQDNQLQIGLSQTVSFTSFVSAAAVGASQFPDPKVRIASSAFLTAVGYGVQANQPTPNPATRTVNNSYALWSKSVQWSGEGTDMDVEEGKSIYPLIFPEEEVSTIRNQLGDHTTDPYWQNSILVDISLRHEFRDWLMQADKYNVNGYDGIETAVVPKETGPAEVFGEYTTAYRPAASP